MKEIYSEYFMEILSKNTDLQVTESDYNEMLQEIAIEGKIDKIVDLAQKYLQNLSNRDFVKFDEKTVVAVNDKIYVEEIK